jgi:hypothetical protein
MGSLDRGERALLGDRRNDSHVDWRAPKIFGEHQKYLVWMSYSYSIAFAAVFSIDCKTSSFGTSFTAS